MSLEGLPSNILLETLFPLLSLKETLSLSSVNKFFAKLGQHDSVWESRLRVDYSFTNTSIAGSRGLKFLYSRIHKPEFYFWGGMFGSMEDYVSAYHPLPEEGMGPLQYWAQTHFNPTVGKIFALPPGEWSFSAVGPSNDIYLIEGGLAGNSMVHPGTWVSHPQSRELIEQSHRRFDDQLGVRVHGGAGQGWCLTGWGRPFVDSPMEADLDTKLIQIQRMNKTNNGPIISAAVTASGNVLVWGFHAKLCPEGKGLIQVRDQLFTKSVGGVDTDSYVTLPGLPKLSRINGIICDSPRIIEIAIGYYYIFGLTDGGHVLRYSLRNFRADHTSEYFGFLNTSGWEYLPQFCERERVERHSAFKGKYALPTDFQITHIAAHNWAFVAYSTGPNSVMLVDVFAYHNNQTPIPKIITPLLRQEIVSVVLGDDHIGVLTGDGRVFTWAQKLPYKDFSRWSIQEPREMRFDYNSLKSRNYFVLAIASTRWEMGALVIDLGHEDSSIRRLVRWRPDWKKFKFILFHYVAGDHPWFGYRTWLRLLAYTVVVPATFMLQCIFPSGRAMYTRWRQKAYRLWGQRG